MLCVLKEFWCQLSEDSDTIVSKHVAAVYKIYVPIIEYYVSYFYMRYLLHLGARSDHCAKSDWCVSSCVSQF